MDLLSDLYGLECAESGCTPDCETREGHYMGTHWKTCPVLAVRRDWRLSAVRHLEQASSVGVSMGDPDDLAAWVVPLWSEYRAERAERARQGK
jgi:hypothetical protein